MMPPYEVFGAFPSPAPRAETFTITRAWKVGQSLGDGWYHAAVCHTWEAVKATAARLRTEGWKGPVEAMPFFCIVDGDTVHEVRTSPLNARGEWVPERECVVRVDE